MKTTVEIPDQLFRDAKAVAIKRRTTLKALLTHALEREIYPVDGIDKGFEIADDGLPYLPAGETTVDTQAINDLIDNDSDY